MVLFNISFLAILVVIYIFNKQNIFDLKSKPLYSGASAFCFTAFIMAIKFSVDPKFGWGPKHTWERLPYLDVRIYISDIWLNVFRQII